MALCSDKVPPICLIITEKTIQVILFPFVNGLLENLVNAVVFEESYLFANGELDYTSLFTICRFMAGVIDHTKFDQIYSYPNGVKKTAVSNNISTTEKNFQRKYQEMKEKAEKATEEAEKATEEAEKATEEVEKAKEEAEKAKEEVEKATERARKAEEVIKELEERLAKKQRIST